MRVISVNFRTNNDGCECIEFVPECLRIFLKDIEADSVFPLSTNVNGIVTFQFGGHIHPDGRSVDVVIDDSNGTVEYGTLVHQ